jgi:tetratricopeptide (TPR) repeat protein
MYGQALQGYQKELGPEHMWTLDTVYNLGNLYKIQGKLAEAEQIYERALDGYEKALGADNVTTYIPALNVIWSLGFLFKDRADFAKARTMYSKSLAGYEKVFGIDHHECQRLRRMLQALEKEYNRPSHHQERSNLQPTHDPRNIPNRE